ncbi:MAG: DUF115 domain-containing protein [Treponema sp.]|nr:DUF115 domain-containing protein [Treponema sp.]
MALEFFTAKNSSKSARANGVALHSAYNPQVEGERFAQSLQADFNPKFVVILEGALSYCAPFVKKRFPNAKVGTIRFVQDFSQTDKEWDFAIPLSDEGLFDFFGEEALFQTVFFDWKPSAAAWPQQSAKAWSQIKEATLKAKTVLATREHFGKRWLKNKISFFYKMQKAAEIKEITKPILVCASGPSLQDALDSIKKVRDKVFVCALSSATSVLAFNKIEPDLILSCDGGWWAKKHLDPLRTIFKDVPLALEPESACPSVLLQKKQILPLCYDDDLFSQKAFEALGVKSLKARRNGTVSGSALELFLSLTKKEIFFAGLDLAPSKKNSHALPNVLETERDAKDFRLGTRASRQAAASLYSESLKIYQDWFAAFDLKGRGVFRIKGSEDFSNALGQIKDIDQRDFESRCLKESGRTDGQKTFFEAQDAAKGMDKTKKQEAIKNIFLEWAKSESFCEELFPADTIMLRRAALDQDKLDRKKIIERKKSELIEKVFGGQK